MSEERRQRFIGWLEAEGGGQNALPLFERLLQQFRRPAIPTDPQWRQEVIHDLIAAAQHVGIIR